MTITSTAFPTKELATIASCRALIDNRRRAILDSLQDIEAAARTMAAAARSAHEELDQ